MKGLSNPWVSGGLAAVAVLVVGYQIFSPQLKSRLPAPSPVPMVPPAASTAAAPVPSASPMSSQTSTQAVVFLPAESINLKYGETHCAEWADAPGRDPFRLQPVRIEKSSHRYPSPVAGWSLKAIWRQTGGRVAAINKRVYTEGDVIEGYKVRTIDADQVWFEGPDGVERLGFKGRVLSASKPPSEPKR